MGLAPRFPCGFEPAGPTLALGLLCLRVHSPLKVSSTRDVPDLFRRCRPPLSGGPPPGRILSPVTTPQQPANPSAAHAMLCDHLYVELGCACLATERGRVWQI